MKDLTQGPITRQLIGLSVPIAIGMLFQTLYFLVDLYFVSRLGDAAIAGVSSAGTVTFVILALTQMLGAGTVALVAQAAGRKDQPGANLIFNQSVLLSALCGLATLAAGFILGGPLSAGPRRGHGLRGRGPRLPLRLHTGAGAAVRAGRPRLGAARHGDREADHAGADADRAREPRAGAGPHRRLGHAPPARNRRRGAGQQHRRGGRRAAAVAVLRAARALRAAEPAALAPARAQHPRAS